MKIGNDLADPRNRIRCKEIIRSTMGPKLSKFAWKAIDDFENND